ncbi:pyruvate ferredoxin oxidoreductase, partial [Candidatus Bathyarchaeota archaeon]
MSAPTTLREIASRPDMLYQGVRTCSGCGASLIAKLVLKALRKPVVVVSATGCLEVASSILPYTSWKVPWIHNAFENAAATASGVEAAYRAMMKKGLIKEMPDIVVLAGDGGTYDIGFQSLSGAIERGHDLLYVLYDNEAYMNTGIQRSGGTPR